MWCTRCINKHLRINDISRCSCTCSSNPYLFIYGCVSADLEEDADEQSGEQHAGASSSEFEEPKQLQEKLFDPLWKIGESECPLKTVQVRVEHVS